MILGVGLGLGFTSLGGPAGPQALFRLTATSGISEGEERVWSGNDAFATWSQPLAPVAIVDGATTGPLGALDGASYTPPAGNNGPPGLIQTFADVEPNVPVVVECSYKAGPPATSIAIIAPDFGGGVTIANIHTGELLAAGYVGSVTAQSGDWWRLRNVYPPAGSSVAIATVIVEAVGEEGPDFTYDGALVGYLWHATARQVAPINTWTDTMGGVMFGALAPTGGAAFRSAEFPWPVAAAGVTQPVRLAPNVALVGSLESAITSDTLTIAFCYRYDDRPAPEEMRIFSLAEVGQTDDTLGSGGVAYSAGDDGAMHWRRGADVLTTLMRPDVGTIVRCIAVFDGTFFHLYENGVEVQIVPSTGPFNMQDILLHAKLVGGSAVPQPGWTTVYELRLYADALTVDQVATVDASLAASVGVP